MPASAGSILELAAKLVKNVSTVLICAS